MTSLHSQRARLLPALILLVVFAIALCTLSVAEAAPNPRYASIVIDTENGAVLHADNADAPRYPASLTKMMTLYLLFEAIEDDTLSLESRLPVSQYAAAKPPSKMGVTPGETVKVEDAINILIVKSANDVAAVVAEGLAGSESVFAGQMTDKARALGMMDTTFRNASGLPDAGQVTTARDMAILALRLMQDFPGRWTGDTLWIEKPGAASVNDGVARVLVGGADFAGAWAIDEAGRPLFPVSPGGDRQREMAYRFGVNLVMYALTGNYKADQVHLPALLERLGQ